MDLMLLTQNSTPIFKYIVKLLGLIMNANQIQKLENAIHN